MAYEEFWQPLLAVYDQGEAKAIARLVMEVEFGLSMTDIVCGKVSAIDGQALLHIRERLLAGEPVQYVLGKATFGDYIFKVAPGVLIPRPETFELCQWVVSRNSESGITNILDIGTGSGCIACTLAAELPQAQVTAWDISHDALDIAAENARQNHVDVTFEQVDILDAPPIPQPLWDIIVSNPPYVCRSERPDMEPHVLNHEPELALFVPDDDPLLFYRSIAHYAKTALKPGGRVFFEINPLYAKQLRMLMEELGFGRTIVKDDQFGKERFLCIYE